jgi:hypothetical protein
MLISKTINEMGKKRILLMNIHYVQSAVLDRKWKKNMNLVLKTLIVQEANQWYSKKKGRREGSRKTRERKFRCR